MATKARYIEPVTTTTLPEQTQVVWLKCVSDTDDEKIELKKEISSMRAKIVELEKRIPQERVLVLRDIPREQARNEVKELFESGRTLYYSDIADELSLDLEFVVSVCNELLESGDIHLDDTIA